MAPPASDSNPNSGDGGAQIWHTRRARQARPRDGIDPSRIDRLHLLDSTAATAAGAQAGRRSQSNNALSRPSAATRELTWPAYYYSLAPRRAELELTTGPRPASGRASRAVFVRLDPSGRPTLVRARNCVCLALFAECRRPLLAGPGRRRKARTCKRVGASLKLSRSRSRAQTSPARRPRAAHTRKLQTEPPRGRSPAEYLIDGARINRRLESARLGPGGGRLETRPAHESLAGLSPRETPTRRARRGRCRPGLLSGAHLRVAAPAGRPVHSCETAWYVAARPGRRLCGSIGMFCVANMVESGANNVGEAARAANEVPARHKLASPARRSPRDGSSGAWPDTPVD